jgi:hypothetical protein
MAVIIELSAADQDTNFTLTVRLPASCGDCKWFGDGHKRDSAESAGI